MTRFRLSIASLLGGIALLGVALAALMSPSPLWGNAFYSLTAGTLLISLLASIYRRGERRAFWVGFATLGWAYHLAYYGPAPLSNVGPNLVTPALFDFFYRFTIPKDASGVAVSTPIYSSPWLATIQDGATPPVTFYTSPGTANSGVVFVGGFGSNSTVLPVPTAWEIWTTPDRATQFNQASPKYFQRIGHALSCLLIASLGGLLTRWFYRTRDEPAPV